MTPEQEDAHWALQGKPLMRHWREHCQAAEKYRMYMRKADIHRSGAGDVTTALILEGYAGEARDKALELWNQYGFQYATKGAYADGVFYSREDAGYDT